MARRGETMAPAAPASIALVASILINARPNTDTATTTGARPFMRAIARPMKARDSSSVNFGASPITPGMVRPFVPRSR